MKRGLDRQDWAGEIHLGKRQVDCRLIARSCSAAALAWPPLHPLAEGAWRGAHFEDSLAHTPTSSTLQTHWCSLVCTPPGRTHVQPHLHTGICFHKHQSQTHHTPHRRRAPRLTEADPEDGAGAFSAAQGHQGASAGLLRPWGVWGASPPICSCLLPLWGNAYLWIPPLFFH